MKEKFKCLLFSSFMIVLAIFPSCQKENGQSNHGTKDYPIKPVPFSSVIVEDDFWLPCLEANRKISIPHALRKSEETGRVENFAIAAGRKTGRYRGRRFNDSDVYKVIEGAAYSLRVNSDPELEKDLDGVIELIASAQEEDGYLYPARTIHPEDPAPGAGPERWSRLRGSHELYNVGHLYEAAVAHFEATGKRILLDVALKNAGLLLKTFGPDKRQDIPGHQEIEIGLAKLYRVTGNKKYLELAQFFLDERGKPHEGGLYPEDSPFAIYNGREYMQDHKPVTEQMEAVGHAVRATYLYSGMADVAALSGNQDYLQALGRLWENVVSKKLYLTGGLGSRHTSEAFGEAYELPNISAYTETCASIGNAFWNLRMFLLHGDAKYIDIMERVISNGLLSGVSIKGDCFFYQNPLASDGSHERSPWFEVACCPSNMVRFLPAFPGYIYAQKDDSLYVNLFVQSAAEIKLKSGLLKLRQQTRYPWEGKIKISLDPEKEMAFAILVRIPGWAQDRPVPGGLYRFLGQSQEQVSLSVNMKPLEVVTEKGYARLSRKWKRGDTISLEFPLPIRRVISHENVVDNRGKVALQRGPLVYCLEGADNEGKALNLGLPDGALLETEFKPDLLNGVVVIKGEAAGARFTAIPYFAWANRGKGEMAVWLERLGAKTSSF